MFNEFKNVTNWNMSIPQKQLENAKLYTSRWHWIGTLKKNIKIIEVGVAAGDFSNEILKQLNPEKLVLIDTFDQCDPMLAAKDRPLRYLEGENEQFIKERFKDYSQVEIIRGVGSEVLPTINDKFDMIYLDSNHQYDNVCNEIMASIPLLNEDGIIAINDYTIYNPDGDDYGTIKAANGFLIANPDWEVIGFALNEEMYCDVYLRRIKK